MKAYELREGDIILIYEDPREWLVISAKWGGGSGGMFRPGYDDYPDDWELKLQLLKDGKYDPDGSPAEYTGGYTNCYNNKLEVFQYNRKMRKTYI